MKKIIFSFLFVSSINAGTNVSKSLADTNEPIRLPSYIHQDMNFILKFGDEKQKQQALLWLNQLKKELARQNHSQTNITSKTQYTLEMQIVSLAYEIKKPFQRIIFRSPNP